MGLLYMLALWLNVCVIRGFGSISFVTTMQPFQWFGHYRMNIISWCGPLEVRFDCTTNITYGMLCNGWGTDIVL
jgi:hypothetical protein